MKKQLAVLFPGIGYHADRPLLYYSAKLARAHDCEVTSVQYPALPPVYGTIPNRSKQPCRPPSPPSSRSWKPFSAPITTESSSFPKVSAPQSQLGTPYGTACTPGRCTSRPSKQPYPISIPPASPFTEPPTRGRAPSSSPRAAAVLVCRCV